MNMKWDKMKKKCSECEHFSLISKSTNEGHCKVDPPIPIRWRHIRESPTVTNVEIVAFGPSRTYAEQTCGSWEEAHK